MNRCCTVTKFNKKKGELTTLISFDTRNDLVLNPKNIKTLIHYLTDTFFIYNSFAEVDFLQYQI